MFTLHGTPCPVPATGQLIATSCGGNLVTVPASFPGSRRPGILFQSPEQAAEFRREVYARACERLAESCNDSACTTGRYLQAEMCIEAARLCRLGKMSSPVVRDVIRFAGPVVYEWRAYGMPLPAGAVDR